MKNLFIGTVLDFEKIHGDARLKTFGLFLLTGLSGLIVLFVGFSMARHFLGPLRSLEQGFLGVLSKNLDIRLNLERDDELGDAGRAFDKMVVGLKEREELGRFVSGTLNISIEKSEGLPLEPELKPGAVLASDIRNFTTISEGNPPEVVVEMLNKHLDLMSREIKQHGGFIDKFVGDAIVAVFLEGDLSSSVKKAIMAAQGMMRQHRRIIEARTKGGRFGYGIGIGIDCGTVLAGTFGSAERMEFTVLGAPRQRAEELEACSKKGIFTRIVVSADVKQECPDIELNPMAEPDCFEVVHL